ncbi:hypothetical protein HDU96_003094 [Phlyctochytrium bullatum]|nr:hypothetical protein HDU96_003094 [Phlyctochytrium bullatum]
MDRVDLAINRADTFLSRRRDPKAAFISYLYAIRLIIDHMLTSTGFSDGDKVDGSGETQKVGFKNHVSAKPSDSERLFGLAHLCFTEVEDIVNEELDTDDLEDDADEEDEDDVEERMEADVELQRIVVAMQPVADVTQPQTPEPQASKLAPLQPPERTSSNLKNRTPPVPNLPPASSATEEIPSMERTKSFRDSPLGLGDSMSVAEDTAAIDSSVSKVNGTVCWQHSKPALSPEIIAAFAWAPNSDYARGQVSSAHTLVPTGGVASQSSPQAALAAVRKLVETSQVKKEKMKQVAVQVNDLAKKTVLDFTPKSLAANITLMDWNLFARGLRNQDIAFFASNPHKPTPHSLRSFLDFAFYLSRLVQTTILREKSSQVRGKILSHWIDVLEDLITLNDFQAVDAVLHALTHPAIANLERSWAGVSRRSRTKLDEARPLVSPADGFRWHRLALSRAATASFPVVPLMRCVLEDSLRSGGLAGAMAALDAHRASGESGYASLGKDKSDAVLHWLMTQKWVIASEIERISYELEEPLTQGMRILGKLRGRESRAGSSEALEGEEIPPLVVPVSVLAEKNGIRTSGTVHGPMLIAMLPSATESMVAPPIPERTELAPSSQRSSFKVQSTPKPESEEEPKPTQKHPDEILEVADPLSLNDLDFAHWIETFPTIESHIEKYGPPDEASIIAQKFLFRPEVQVPGEPSWDEIFRMEQENPDSFEVMDDDELGQRIAQLKAHFNRWGIGIPDP